MFEQNLNVSIKKLFTLCLFTTSGFVKINNGFNTEILILLSTSWKIRMFDFTFLVRQRSNWFVEVIINTYKYFYILWNLYSTLSSAVQILEYIKVCENVSSENRIKDFNCVFTHAFIKWTWNFGRHLRDYDIISLKSVMQSQIVW